MAPGLDPMDAVDRLKKFQQMFEVSFAAASGPACCCGEVPCFRISRWQYTFPRLYTLLAAAERWYAPEFYTSDSSSELHWDCGGPPAQSCP